jgi:hypothetical protein
MAAVNSLPRLLAIEEAAQYVLAVCGPKGLGGESKVLALKKLRAALVAGSEEDKT